MFSETVEDKLRASVALQLDEVVESVEPLGGLPRIEIGRNSALRRRIFRALRHVAHDFLTTSAMEFMPRTAEYAA